MEKPLEEILINYYFGSQKSIRMFTPQEDHIGRILKSSGVFYEIQLLERAIALFGKPKVVLDIGANIGNHSLFWSTIFGAKVISIEANPDVYAILQRNIQANGLSSSVIAHNVACGEAERQVSLEQPRSGNIGTGRIIDCVGGNPPGENVLQRTVDAILETETPDWTKAIDLVKIDVEGYEYQVLQGAKSILKNGNSNLWVEVFPSSLDKCRHLIESFGYRYCFGPFGDSDNYFFSKTKKNVVASALKAKFIASNDRGYLSRIRNGWRAS